MFNLFNTGLYLNWAPLVIGNATLICNFVSFILYPMHLAWTIPVDHRFNFRSSDPIIQIIPCLELHLLFMNIEYYFQFILHITFLLSEIWPKAAKFDKRRTTPANQSVQKELSARLFNLESPAAVVLERTTFCSHARPHITSVNPTFDYNSL